MATTAGGFLATTPSAGGFVVVVDKPRFGITPTGARNCQHQLFATTSNENENTAPEAATTVCDMPTDVAPVGDFVSQKGSAKLLRSAVLTDVNGNQIALGDKMGSTTTTTSGGGNTSIVVFLRHLG